MERNIAIFRTLDIVERYLSKNRKACVTGKLERALAQGYKIFVASTRHEDTLDELDNYWLPLVGRENCFFADVNYNDVGRRHPGIQTGWRKLFDHLGIKWEPSRPSEKFSFSSAGRFIEKWNIARLGDTFLGVGDGAVHQSKGTGLIVSYRSPKFGVSWDKGGASFVPLQDLEPE